MRSPRRRRRWPRGRPWGGAFNVVMATGIVSIACRDAGLELVSQAFLWLALLAFAPLAVIDARRARRPLGLLRRAGQPEHGFSAMGFVADTCVLGARLTDEGVVARLMAAILLVVGAVVWVGIAASLVRSRAGGEVDGARGEWLLAVVATEGLAILCGELASAGYGDGLHVAGEAFWALGGLLYLIIGGLLAGRLLRAPLRPGELTPDWWIVMGGAAIFALASATLEHAGVASAEGVAALAGWGVATAWIPVLFAAELWQAHRTGPPRFSPARWTMVFPLGMYSAAGQVIGHKLGLPWIMETGRWWLAVALLAWAAVALGEICHAFVVRSDCLT